MGNVFPPNKDIHEVYDLKGSTFGRYSDEELAKSNPHTVLKDLNWINRHRQLQLGPEKSEFFLAQIQRDVSFLKTMQIMDYSLLVGVHDVATGNRDNIRDTTLSVFEPKPDSMWKQANVLRSMHSKSQAQAMRKVLEASDLVQLGPSTSQLPDDAPPE
jgi:1-phosphatidylinositol-4-phosphate 5-kinase